MRQTGKIRSYIESRGFGFLERPGAPPLFFHVRDVIGLEDESQLRPGVEVTFDLMTNGEKSRAVEVELVGVRA